MKKQSARKVIVCHVLYAFDGIGGLENGVVNIINGLDSQIFHHVICSLTTIGDIQRRIKKKNVSYCYLGKSDGNDFTIPYKLFRIFRTQKVDVVHLRNWPTMVEGYVAAKCAGIKKIIYSEHGRHFEPVWNGERVKSTVIKYILNQVDVCLCVSASLAQEMAHLYKLSRKIDVILNGVNVHKFSNKLFPEHVVQYGIKDTCVIGTVGRLDKGKRFDELILDFLSNCPNGQLVVIGDGPERERLTQITNEKGQGRVLLLGQQDNIPELLNCMDLFVLSSESEGLSNAIMEAVSSGLPVVAYDVGGNKEMVHQGKGGILVEWHQRDRFMDAVNELLGNRNLAKRMREYNRELACSTFSLETMISRYANLYYETI